MSIETEPLQADTAATTTTVELALAFLHDPGETFEVRILGSDKGTVAGYFDNARDAAAMIAKWDGKAEGIYHTVNPCDPALLARSTNRLREYTKRGSSTTDKDITRRRWLPIDVDAVRPSGISATDDEVRAAWRVICCIKAHLEDDLGWPAGVLAMSGNGGHLYYRVDLPNDDESHALLKRLLEKVAAEYDEQGVAEVDTTVHNAARIMKVPGTLACKGDASDERPHRRSHLLEVPDEAVRVPTEALQALAGPAKAKSPSTPFTGGNGHRAAFDIEEWMSRYGLAVRSHKTEAGGDLWELEVCPFNADHDHGEAFISRAASGALLAGCHHNSCAWWHWGDLRKKFEPDYKDKQREWEQGRPTARPPLGHDCSDDGNAQRLMDRHGDIIRYLPEEETWLVWDERRWRRDDGHRIENLTAQALRDIHHEAGDCADEAQRKRLASWAITSGAAARRTGAIMCARSEPELVVHKRDLDKNAFQLNVLNGTLNLRTGKLGPHRQEDAITWLAPVEFAGLDVRDETFEKVITEATGGDADYQRWLQRYAGMSLVGETTELVLILLGESQTGKSTLTGALTAMLGEGDYALTGNQEALLKKDHAGGPRGGIMSFEGRRLVTIPEFDHSKTLDDALIKTLTGEATFRGRDLYEREHDMRPVSKLWIHTNYMPKVAIEDDALWRRFRIAPFNHKPAKIDETIKLYLLSPAPRPAILAWALRGCLAWQKDGGGASGLGPCSIVADATRKLRITLDPLAEFFDDCCIFEPGRMATSDAIRDRYSTWADRRNIPIRRRSGDKARAAGLLLRHCASERLPSGRRERVWFGVGIREADQEALL